MSHDDKLVYMANQIGRFFASQGEAKAVPGIASHIRRYWDPSMRRAIAARARDGAATGLDPWTLAAVLSLDETPAAGPDDARATAPGLTPSETARV